ncbi:MAG: hypothetical protein KatS3mg110_1671 [Pirellulaceae bacterium]|nr:MAG: hypothetical protein KatS3mg110_1671 [Pirellulaceae bacterium]
MSVMERKDRLRGLVDQLTSILGAPHGRGTGVLARGELSFHQ